MGKIKQISPLRSNVKKQSNPKIGTTGVIKSSKSDSGIQYPHLPAANSYSGGHNTGRSGGAVAQSTNTDMPHMPKGSPSKK